MNLTIRENGMANSVTLLGPNGGEIARVWKHGRGEEYARLFVAALRMREVLQKVAAHFEGTDSPLGQEASALLREIKGKEAT